MPGEDRAAVKREAPPDADDGWEEFPLENIPSSSSESWSLSQVKHKADERTQPVTPLINVNNANTVYNIHVYGDSEQLRSLFPDRDICDRGASHYRPVRNASRRTEIRRNTRDSPTRRYNVQDERTSSRSREYRRLERNRRDRSYPRNRRYTETTRERYGPSWYCSSRNNEIVPAEIRDAVVDPSYRRQ